MAVEADKVPQTEAQKSQPILLSFLDCLDSRSHCVIHHHVHPSRVYVINGLLP